MYIMCPDAFYSQTQSNVIYLAILSILFWNRVQLFSCTSSSYPLETYERDLVVYNYVCTKSQFTVCWEVKIHCALCVHKLNVCWEVRIYFTVVCTQTHKFTKTQCVLGQNLLCTLQLCVHKLTSVKLDQTHTALTGWSPLWILFKECRQGRIWIRMESTFEK